MPFCSHCSRNVSRKTELLHRKHGARPRLTTDVVAAFRKSAKISAARIAHAKVHIQVAPLVSESDAFMDEGPSTQQPDHDFALDTNIATHTFDESRDGIFRAAMNGARTHLWPDGTRPYAARVDDYESDAEDEEENDDGSDGVDDGSFDDDTIDVTDYANRLSAWDELGEEFEREASENCKLIPRRFISMLIGWWQFKILVLQTWPFCVRLR